MEPRPTKSQRPAAPPVQALPPAGSQAWAPPSSPAASPSSSASTPASAFYSGAPGDGAASGAWYEPPPGAGAAQPPGYSPGPALTPIDSGRGARVIGPVIALLVLAAIVGGAVYMMLRVIGGDDNPRDNDQIAAATGTASVLASAPTSESVATSEPTQESGAVAGADETAAPTEEAIDSPPEQTPTTGEAVAEPTRNSPPSARSLLPAPDDIGSGYERTEDDKRAREAVADSFSDPADALAKLESWKWRENAYRTFEIPAANNPDVNDTTVINISIHRFGDEQGAKDALNYFADDVIATQGLDEFRIDRIGEQTRALKSNVDGSNVVLYVRNGNYLIRIGGYSPEGDPTDDLIAVATSIVE